MTQTEQKPTHKVLRPLDAGAEEKLAPGTLVNAEGWLHTDLLTKQGYIERLEVGLSLDEIENPSTSAEEASN